MSEFFINIDQGQVVQKKVMREAITSLPTGRYLVRIDRKDKRSLPQNAYLHTIFPMIKKGLQDIGYKEVKTAEDAKWVCKSLFLSYDIDNGTGGKIKMVRRTRDLTKDQMSEFIANVQQWAATYLSIVIPDPETQTEMQWTEQKQ